MCAQSELIVKVESLKEWQELLSQAEEMVESIKDELKMELNSRDVEELEAGTHIIRFTTILSNRFDTTSFKREHGELYKTFTKQVTSKRFSIS